MLKNLNLIDNSTESPSVQPSDADTPWCRNVLVPNRLRELTSLVPKRLGPNRLGAETTWCHNVCKSPECRDPGRFGPDSFGRVVSVWVFSANFGGGSSQPYLVGRFGRGSFQPNYSPAYDVWGILFSGYPWFHFVPLKLMECIRMENVI